MRWMMMVQECNGQQGLSRIAHQGLICVINQGKQGLVR
jgi:hypothetical protein